MSHAPAALGNIVPLAGDLPEGSPPTSYAAHAALKGDARSIAAFAGLTLLRSLLIAPGLAIAGIRGKTLIYGSLAASGVISGTALGYVIALKKKKAFESAQRNPNAAPVQEQGALDQEFVNTTGEAAE